MKPKIKYTISINRSKNGQFFWSVKAGNSKGVGTTGEPNVNKAHVVRMAKSLFLAGFWPIEDGMYEIPMPLSGGKCEYRLLQDLTKPKKTK